MCISILLGFLGGNAKFGHENKIFGNRSHLLWKRNIFKMIQTEEPGEASEFQGGLFQKTTEKKKNSFFNRTLNAGL